MLFPPLPHHPQSFGAKAGPCVHIIHGDLRTREQRERRCFLPPPPIVRGSQSLQHRGDEARWAVRQGPLGEGPQDTWRSLPSPGLEELERLLILKCLL